MTAQTHAAALPRTTAIEPRAILVYDGECPFCRRCVTVVRMLDWARMLEPLPWSRAVLVYPEVGVVPLDEGVRVRLPDAQVMVGIDGVRETLIRLPLLFLAGVALYLPPVRRAGERLYRQIAERRCSGDSCS